MQNVWQYCGVMALDVVEREGSRRPLDGSDAQPRRRYGSADGVEVENVVEVEVVLVLVERGVDVDADADADEDEDVGRTLQWLWKEKEGVPSLLNL